MPEYTQKDQEIILQDLNKRNTQTVEMALREMNDRIYEQSKRIAIQSEALQALSSKIIELEKLLVIQKVMLTGMGPSVKHD